MSYDNNLIINGDCASALNWVLNNVYQGVDYFELQATSTAVQSISYSDINIEKGEYLVGIKYFFVTAINAALLQCNAVAKVQFYYDDATFGTSIIPLTSAVVATGDGWRTLYASCYTREDVKLTGIKITILTFNSSTNVRIKNISLQKGLSVIAGSEIISTSQPDTKNHIVMKDTYLDFFTAGSTVPKLRIGFQSDTADDEPIIILGIGTNVNNDNGKAYIEKEIDGVYIRYNHSITGAQKVIKITDDGVLVDGVAATQRSIRNIITVTETPTEPIGEAGDIIVVEGEIPPIELPILKAAAAGAHGHSGATSSAIAHSHTVSVDVDGLHNHGINGGVFLKTYDEFGTAIGLVGWAESGAHAHIASSGSNGGHGHSVTVDAVLDHEHTVEEVI